MNNRIASAPGFQFPGDTTVGGVRFWLLISLAAMAVFSGLGLVLGPDRNWDLRHYHLYLPYSVLNGRSGIDHNAADIHTYLNPTLDILFTYPLLMFGGQRVLATVMGAVHGLNFVMLMAIGLRLLNFMALGKGHERLLLAALLGALGMSGALVVAEIGNTFGDLTTAPLVLAGLLCCMCAAGDQSRQSNWRLVAWSGLMLGLATGVKLTNAPMLCGLGAALFVFSGKQRWQLAFTFCAMAALGLMLGYGWWGWRLWQTTGNPLFPYFNSIFQSPLFPSSSYFDKRWMPWGWRQALIYPVYYSWNAQTGETYFRDFRFLVGYTLTLLLIARVVWLRLRKVTDGRGQLDNEAKLFAVFVVISYVLWQVIFSIQRYAMPLELVMPAFALLLFWRLYGQRGVQILVAVALAWVVTTIPANYNDHAGEAPYGAMMEESLRKELVSTIDGGAVVLGLQPIAILAVLLRDADAAWFGETRTPADAAEARRKLAGRKRVFALSLVQSAHHVNVVNQRLAVLGQPPINLARCRQFRTSFHSNPLMLCQVSGDSPPPRDAGKS